ncbi:MAG TPA: glycine zipper domain-containing protein [Pirellulales bacterium]|nr:glycine zipper domain-containing protein [Pirellulales bacterium]
MLGRHLPWIATVSALLALGGGCYTPYRSQSGALAGGLGGAGVGALVGSAVHHPVAGALVGAGVGAASGAAIGGAIDQSEANNRALIESRLGRPVPGAVTVGDVINMSQAGVPENVIITHVQTHGVAVPVQPNDLIMMQKTGVSPRVVQSMQVPVVPMAQPVVVAPAAGPVVVAPPPPAYMPVNAF